MDRVVPVELNKEEENCRIFIVVYLQFGGEGGSTFTQHRGQLGKEP